MRKTFFSGTIVSAILVVVIGVVLFPVLAPRPTVDSEVVRRQVQELQTLVTGEYAYRDVVYFDEETRLLGIRTGSQEILFSVQILVTAGVDLGEAVTVDRVNQRAREIFLTVPEPEVLRVEAQESSIDQYFIREGFRGIDWLDVAEEVETAKARNREDAIARGILDRSRVQAEFLLDNLLRSAGYETVHIRFRPHRNEELRG